MLLKSYPDTGGKAVKEGKGPLWSFLPDNSGAFIAPYADYISRLYFPLLNTYGMKCSITPEMKGDIASSFERFLTAATVTEELHRNVSGRNGWVSINGEIPWSVAGNSATQRSKKWQNESDESEIEGRIGAFIHRRRNKALQIESEVTVFVPVENDFVELTKVVIKNLSEDARSIAFTAATAIFARHADNFRDHRQVTTMFQKVKIQKHGVSVCPNIVHDEHGHLENKVIYSVLGYSEKGQQPLNIWPLMADFIGEGGSLDHPEAVYRNMNASDYNERQIDGKEAIGAFQFSPVVLGPGESMEYIVLHGITDVTEDIELWGNKYGTVEKFNSELKKALERWTKTAEAVKFNSGNTIFDNWMKWVTFQLLCRQVYGNSYLPDFGYGRGGRGWRDLWQDLLSIFLVDPAGTRQEMLNNFKGVRVDGSNATIIGSKPGEFIADRNNVPRTWCDHGVWPVFVLDYYIQQTGDLDILENQVTYWKDKFAFRCREIDELWDKKQGFAQLDQEGRTYEGSILEHILLQQLTSFFNVGDNNNLRLEGGDWNDTLDMARERGESVCFYSFYSFNIATIVKLLKLLITKGKQYVVLMSEILLLTDRLSGQSKIDYDNPKLKRERLSLYLNTVKHNISGEKVNISIEELVIDLTQKSEHIKKHIREKEWKHISDDAGFFNGHYDNLGNPIHGKKNDKIMIDLTSQVMPVLCDIADSVKIRKIWKAVKYYLKDKERPGLRLCSEFEKLDLNIGRITGFTYGQKEHGSKWSQQMIMFVYALYKQGFVEEGFELLTDVYKLSTNSAKSLVFPGLPSFFGPDDRGAYNYLTGSSTWLIMTLTTQIFGVDAYMGDLSLKPKLNDWFFDRDGKCSIERNFRDFHLVVIYSKKGSLKYPEYSINNVLINKEEYPVRSNCREIIVPYASFLKSSVNGECRIEIELR